MESSQEFYPPLAEEVNLVEEALQHPKWRLRTAESVVAETGLSRESVTAILKESGIARQSPLKRNGAELYAPFDQKMNMREILEAIRWILAR